MEVSPIRQSHSNNSLADEAANKLLEVIKNYANEERFIFSLSLNERKELKEACTAVKKYLNQDFNFKYFYKLINNFHFPPLEFIWTLHVLNIMSLDIYLELIILQPAIVKILNESITSSYEDYFVKPNIDFPEHFLIYGFFSFFMTKSFPPNENHYYDAKIKELCLSFIKNIINSYLLMPEEDIIGKVNFLLMLDHCGGLEKSSLQSFYQFLLCYFLNIQPNIREKEAFQIQEKWITKKAQLSFPKIKCILPLIEPKEVQSIFYSAVKSKDSNLKSLLILTSLLQIIETNNLAWGFFIESLIQELIVEAFSLSDENLIFIIILLGRQIVLHQRGQFHVVYNNWFQAHFAENLIKNFNHFILLLQVLTNLIPLIENIDILKISLEKPFQFSSEYQIIFDDYAESLKSRIKELQPSPPRLEAIEKILQTFEKTNKIPSSLLEYSLLQKHLFQNEFLRFLLKPRKLPHVPDTKMKFIEALKQAGKIPASMFENYIKECKKEDI